MQGFWCTLFHMHSGQRLGHTIACIGKSIYRGVHSADMGAYLRVTVYAVKLIHKAYFLSGEVTLACIKYVLFKL